jgi:polysaccharide export outer membrane protein
MLSQKISTFALVTSLASGTAPAQTGTAGQTPAITPPVAAEEGPSTPTSPSYVVGAQDQLSITVFDEPSLTGTYRVDNDGFFTFPLLNRVRAAGLSLADLQDALTAMLANGFLRNPQVRVEIAAYKSQSVIVTGQVRAPGELVMTSASMTLLQALAQAGSPTADASNEVIVQRRAGEGEAQGETIRVNRRELELGRAGHDIVLRDGDIIHVPKAETFFVDGQVRNPGAYVFDPGITVQQAIALAGGLSERGSDRGIVVNRVVNGRTQDVPVRLQDLVQPGDTIKVRARFF